MTTAERQFSERRPGQCAKPTEVFSRVVGFYRPIHQWNKGKQAEFFQRLPFRAVVK